VRITVFEGDDRLEVCVDDHGRGFDPEALPAHPPVTDPERLNFERGLGIPLIRTLVDDAQFWTSREGTSVHLIVYGGSADSVPAEGDADVEPAAAPGAEER
jgi:anti-sigma regulatory factor (Ser/Thr protein kinase)